MATHDGQLTAAVVTTEIARGIAHIAQVVVDPAHRARVLRQLLLRAGAAASAQGAKRLTLMVGETNQAARALYDGLGFAARGASSTARAGPCPALSPA